ncbi:MAG: hypothetical protein ABGW87_13900 [Sphingomonadaceae bacterium]
MADHFADSLARLAEVMADARDPWWIIGSAAVKLLGGEPGRIADIDVIVSRCDLEALYQRIPLRDARDAGKAIFRSERFGLWNAPELPIEFMAGLEVLNEGSWLKVQPQTRQQIFTRNTALYVPEAAEMIGILISFGRDKDYRRAATLSG